MKNIKFAFGQAVLIILLVAGGALLKAQTCDTTSASVTGYTGGDDSTLDKESMTGITNDTTSLLLRLNQKGANFIPGSDYPVTGNNRMTGAAADFNGDGFVDLVEGGRATDYNTNSSLGNRNAGDSNIAFYISRAKDPLHPERFVFDPTPYYLLYAGSILDRTYEIVACGAGDYDRDGDADISVLSWQGRLFVFNNLYVENHLSPGSAPVFNTTPAFLGDLINDGYGEWGQGGDHFRWESNIESVDIDRDGDLDLIVGVPQRFATNRWGEVVIFVNNGSGVFSRLMKTINPYPNNSSYIYAVCGVAAADFDRDGDIDFYVGSANSRSIYFYRNDGLGNFSQYNPRTITIPSRRGTCTMLRAGNMDGDMDVDLVLATDGHNTNTPGGYVFWYKNDGAGAMTELRVPTDGSQLSSSGDLDSGAIGDFDNDGDLDFFVADGNDSRQCYFIMNESYPLYVDTGSVPSRNLLPCDFLTVQEHAVVSATIHVRDEKPAGTSITYYLSNSDDDNGNPLWEGPVTPDVEFTFASPGQFLRWKAEFRSSDERLTPKVFSVRLDYKYIGKREYSRTSQAYTTADVNSSTTGEEEVLYAASFEFPTWKGHLRSWDVTSLTLAANRYSQLEDILDVGADFVEDAGMLLSTRNYSSRRVFTAYDLEGDGVMNDKLDFDASQVVTLDNFLGLGEGSPEAVPLINFVLGEGRNWKLGDINHSSPQAVNPPNGNVDKMQFGYGVFLSRYASRKKTILVGANDGMLHCFDAATMDELWAFIPNNLLYKLKRMRVEDPDCGFFLQHQFFVDGTPAIQDVYFGGDWHTVVVCGQGPGWGKDGKCYYFALDVTDPENPQPLWEFTHETMGETWSVPVIGRIDSDMKWYVFFGSGYDVDRVETLGNYFYALDVATGALVGAFGVTAPSDPASPFGIQNTLPGSPAAVDPDENGSIDAVYFGDLLGRIWKLDLTPAPASWAPVVIYEDPFHHPIVTKPAINVDSSSRTARLYFGTGGDEKATDTSYYSFVCLADTSPATVDWYMGPQTLADRLHLAEDKKKGDLAVGEKVWADPVISGNYIYIATLYGSIESLNPCLTLAGVGKIYARYATGSKAGQSALIGTGGTTVAFLETKQKVRSAVTIGNSQDVDLGGNQKIKKSKVFIQSYTRPDISPPEPPSQVLAQPGGSVGLTIKSWREVYKIQE